MPNKTVKISDLIPDTSNFNTGTEFGESLIEKSFSKFGAGRSILLDKNNKIIAGNKSTQKFVEGGGQNVMIVDADGDTLIAVRRTDIDLDTKRGREMALADNATAKANISWDEAKLTDWEMPTDEWGIHFDDDFDGGDEEGKAPGTDKWFLNIEFVNENDCNHWFDSLSKQGLVCKIFQ